MIRAVLYFSRTYEVLPSAPNTHTHTHTHTIHQLEKGKEKGKEKIRGEKTKQCLALARRIRFPPPTRTPPPLHFHLTPAPPFHRGKKGKKRGKPRKSPGGKGEKEKKKKKTTSNTLIICVTNAPNGGWGGRGVGYSKLVSSIRDLFFFSLSFRSPPALTSLLFLHSNPDLSFPFFWFKNKRRRIPVPPPPFVWNSLMIHQRAMLEILLGLNTERESFKNLRLEKKFTPDSCGKIQRVFCFFLTAVIVFMDWCFHPEVPCPLQMSRWPDSSRCPTRLIPMRHDLHPGQRELYVPEATSSASSMMRSLNPSMITIRKRETKSQWLCAHPHISEEIVTYGLVSTHSRLPLPQNRVDTG